jgi:hypothetical protein
MADRLDYPSLFNALYYMMFRENPNQLIWEKMIKSTIENKDVVPLVYYRPFKISEIFIRNHFPKLEI